MPNFSINTNNYNSNSNDLQYMDGGISNPSTSARAQSSFQSAFSPVSSNITAKLSETSQTEYSNQFPPLKLLQKPELVNNVLTDPTISNSSVNFKPSSLNWDSSSSDIKSTNLGTQTSEYSAGSSKFFSTFDEFMPNLVLGQGISAGFDSYNNYNNSTLLNSAKIGTSQWGHNYNAENHANIQAEHNSLYNNIGNSLLLASSAFGPTGLAVGAALDVGAHIAGAITEPDQNITQNTDGSVTND